MTNTSESSKYSITDDKPIKAEKVFQVSWLRFHVISKFSSLPCLVSVIHKDSPMNFRKFHGGCLHVQVMFFTYPLSCLSLSTWRILKLSLKSIQTWSRFSKAFNLRQTRESSAKDAMSKWVKIVNSASSGRSINWISHPFTSVSASSDVVLLIIQYIRTYFVNFLVIFY